MSKFMGKNNLRLILSWTPGTGGDMVRACLFVLLEPGEWKFKFHYKLTDESMLFLDDKFISKIGIQGEVSTPGVWNDIKKHSVLTSMHKLHHVEYNKQHIHGIIKEGHLNDEFNPLVTFICMKDSKYIDLCKKNYILKRGDEEFNSHWIREIAKDDKYRKENPDKANHVFHELGDKIHMMYMDNFYKWETFKKELEDYLKRYNIDGYKENFPIVKQFWQAWINEQ
jgi:hypothetical protein